MRLVSGEEPGTLHIYSHEQWSEKIDGILRCRRRANVSCNSNSKTEGISLHSFTRNKVYYNKWICFIQRHRANLKPSKTSVRFRVGQRADLNLKETEDTSLFKSTWLKKDAVPHWLRGCSIHVCIAPFRRITRRKFAIWHCIWILTHKAQVDIHNHLRHQNS